MAQVTKDSAETPYYDYLDWSGATIAERNILYNILFKEPEATEARDRLFASLKLNPGEVIPPIPVFRLPEKCQQGNMTPHLVTVTSQHHQPHSILTSYGVPVVTSGQQNGHPSQGQHQQGSVMMMEHQGVGQGPPGLRSYPGQMVQVPPSIIYQQMAAAAAHHQQQQYGSPNSYLAHLVNQQHYAHHPSLGLPHLSYQPPSYANMQGFTGEDLAQLQQHQQAKPMDSHSTTSVSSGSSNQSIGKGNYNNRKGPTRHPRSDAPPPQMNQYNHPVPYYPGMPPYGAVYYNPGLAANVTGQPIILPASAQPQPPPGAMYQQYPTPQHMYQGSDMEESGNCVQIQPDSSQHMIPVTTESHKIPEFIPAGLNVISTQVSSSPSYPSATASASTVTNCSATDTLSCDKVKAVSPIPIPSETETKPTVIETEKVEPMEEKLVDTPVEVPEIPPVCETPIVISPKVKVDTEKEVKEKSQGQEESTRVNVNGPVKGKDPHLTSPPSRPTPRKTGEEGVGSTEFPQLPPSNRAITTNGLKVPSTSSAPSGDGGVRSWASIASSRQTNGPATPFNGPTIDSSSSSRLHSHEPTESSSSLPTTTEVPMGIGEGYVDLAFDPASLSNENDPQALNLGEFLANYQLNHHSLSLIPRGLVNQSNFCYINATLQSLLACPPFVNLFRSLQPIIGRKPCRATPILQSVFDFVMEFEPITRFNQNPKNKRPSDAFYIGPHLDPMGIRRVLSLLDGATFKVEGRQEDAEEFLSHLLNGLHDEMIKTIRWYETKKERKLQASQLHQQPQSVASLSNVNGDGGIVEEEDTEWQVMGPKNKGSMTRKTEVSKSPISEMLVGQMSSLLNRGNTPKTTTLQPFFTLQLDIQDENIHSVKDALDRLSTKEEVSGSSSVNGAEALIWKQLSLEFLPIILVIHLKRFVYDKNCSKIFKLDKRVDFGVDLEIGKELLSVNCRTKMFHSKQRSYKLFAAVYHDGEEAHKGHYVADTFHPSGGSLWGQFGWIRYDDTQVKGVNEGEILNPHGPRVPYLLYYRRVDTLSQNKKPEQQQMSRQ